MPRVANVVKHEEEVRAYTRGASHSGTINKALMVGPLQRLPYEFDQDSLTETKRCNLQMRASAV